MITPGSILIFRKYRELQVGLSPTWYRPIFYSVDRHGFHMPRSPELNTLVYVLSATKQPASMFDSITLNVIIEGNHLQMQLNQFDIQDRCVEVVRV